MSGSYAVASYNGVSAATEQVTITQTVNVGDAVAIVAESGGSGVTLSGATDSQGNTYTIEASTTAQIATYILLANITTKLVAGTDWIKVTFSGAGTGNQWIARGMAGVASGVDIAISASGNSKAPAITSGTLQTQQEWVIFGLGSGNAGGTPTNWVGNGNSVKMVNNGLFVQESTDGPLNVQKTVQNGSGAYCTFVDQVTWNGSALAASASLGASASWGMCCVSVQFSPAYHMGDANVAAGTTTLTVPIVTGSRPNNPVVVAALAGSPDVTSVTDSTGGNVYTKLKSDSAEGYHLSTWQAQGNGRVGMTAFPGAYGVSTNLKAAQDANGFLKRNMAFMSQKRYLNEQEWAGASDDKAIPADLAGGISKIILTIKPLRKNQTTYSGSDYTAELTALTNCLNWFKTQLAANPGTEGAVVLWQECSLNGKVGNFGDGTTLGKKFNPPASPPSNGGTYNVTANSNVYFTLQQPTGGGCTITNVNVNGSSVGSSMGTYYVPGQSAQNVSVSWTGKAPTWFWQNSPYAPGNPGSLAESDAATNYANYAAAYVPTIVASGLPLLYDPAISSYGPAVDYWNAMSPAIQADHSAIVVDYYCSDYDTSQAGKPAAIDSAMVQLEAAADALGIAFGVIEWGFNDGQFFPSPADFEAWAYSKIFPIFQRRLAAGKPCSDLVWYESGNGPNTINASTDPTTLAVLRSAYDLFNETPCAIQTGGSVTVTYGSTSTVKQAIVMGANTPLPLGNAPDVNVTADFASSATPAVSTGTLAGPVEAVFAISATANSGGAPSWSGGWTPIATDVNGSSLYLSAAYQIVVGTTGVTATATLSPAASAQMMAVSFPVPNTANTAALRMGSMSLAASLTVQAAGSNTTFSAGLTMASMKMGARGLSQSGTPYFIGANTVITGTLTNNVPCTVSVTNGDTIQVGVEVPTALTPPSSVGPDTAGNVYTLVGNDTNGTLYIYESDGSSPLVAGVDSIPVVMAAAAASWAAVAIGDNGVTGPDKVVFANGSSTTPTAPSTGTLSQKEEHAIAWVLSSAVGGVPTWSAGWTALESYNGPSQISVAYQVVNATTALTATATDTFSAPWAAGIVTTTVAPNAVSLIPSNGFVGIPYSQTLEDTGGAGTKTWSIPGGGLPPGLSNASGVLSGVPTTAGSYPISLKVTDAQGASATLPVTITILPAQGAGPVTTQMGTNFLSDDDSLFIGDNGGPPAFTWQANINAGAPFAVSNIGFIGTTSLGWASTKDGATAISPTPIAASPGLPYLVSGMILPCASNDIQIGATWYTVTQDPQTGNPVYTAIGATYGPVVTPGSSVWTPLQAAVTAPAGAQAYAPTVLVQQSNAGDVNLIDLMFTTQDDKQVLVDWINPPFATPGLAGSTFMDVSPWTRLDQNGITYFRGRQDAVTDVQATSGSFDLENDNGEWAIDSTISLPAAMGGLVTLQRRIQINEADENGVWWTRADGPISANPYTFDPVGGTSLVNVSFTDVLAFLNRQDPLSCWTKSQILADGPMWHWSLDDAGSKASGSGVAAETSGNNGPSMRLLNSDTTAVGGTGAATIAWDDTSAGVETLADAANATGQDGSVYWSAGSNQPSNPLRGLLSGSVGPYTTPIGSVNFTPYNLGSGSWVSGHWPTGTQAAQNTFVGTLGYELVTELPQPLTPTASGSDYSIECWFMPDASIGTNLSANYGPFIVLGLGSSSTKTNLLCGLFPNSGTLDFQCASYSQPPGFLGLNWPGAAAPTALSSTGTVFTADKVKRPHHLVISIQGSSTAPLVSVWVDGSQIGTTFALPKGQTYDTLTIGGAYGGTGAFYGNISLASIYGYLLSPKEITQHAMLGQYGMWEQTADDCIALISSFTNIPSFWSALNAGHSALTMTDYFDINNANGISSMQQYENAEGGLLYVNSQGALTFRTRADRQGYRAPDMLMPPGLFSEQLQYQQIDQFQVNEEGVASPNTLGATAVVLLANPQTGQTQPSTTTSSVIQAGYINTASQQEYGIYATYSVASPITLPLITWSRGYAALGLPQLSYWIDPGLTDRAAWDANSHAEPWALPAAVTIDVLTLDPTSGITKSQLFALDIGNMIAPSPDTLPPSFPNSQTSNEWFIEGVTETRTVDSWTLEFYVSPAETQRAWIPGDQTYGVLNSTARIGISAADLSNTQADGKSASHDAGPPYWPPTFSSTMNQGGTPGVKGFVGAQDMRGIAQNLQNMLQPAICVVTATSQTQSFTNGGLTGTTPPNIATLYFDSIHVDSAGGMGAVPGWPNWYLVTQAGYYEIDACVTWSTTGAGLGGYTGQAWIIVAQDAAQALAAGTGNPLTVNQYVMPVGEAVRFNANSMTPVCAPTTRMYLGVGDMVCVGAEQNFTGARGTSTAGAGSSLSLVFSGMGQVDDRRLINASLGTGGAVTIGSHGTLQQAVFECLHTYSYQGNKGFDPNQRRNTDGTIYQGQKPNTPNGEGSQNGQLSWNTASIISTLTGKTVLSATLTGTNASTYYSTGGRLMLGDTGLTPGGSTFNIGGSWTSVDMMEQYFDGNQTRTFSIPVKLVQDLVAGNAKAFVFGDGHNTDPRYYTTWVGGPSSWTLTVNYV